jgi:serine/threonine protein kinase
MNSLIPELSRRFEIRSVLGRGGFAVVYAAFDKQLERDVAIKVLQRCHDKDAALRFRREAKVLCRLRHPNIVRFYSFGVLSQETPFLVMQQIQGQSLQTSIQQGLLNPEEIKRIAMEVCKALEFGHSKAIIHRDLKPENILISADGSVHLADFGVCYLHAQSDTDAIRLTQEGETVGSVCYMSPEQACGHQLDGRSDIYSLGCIIYEMLTGQPPFSGSSSLEIMQKHASVSPDRTRIKSQLDPLVSALSNVTFIALEKKPARRFKTAGEMLEALTNPGLLRRRSAEKPTISAGRVLAASAVISMFVIAGIVSVNQIQANIRQREASRKEFNGDRAFVMADVKVPPPPGSGVRDFIRWKRDSVTVDYYQRKMQKLDAMREQIRDLVLAKKFHDAQKVAKALVALEPREILALNDVLHAVRVGTDNATFQRFLDDATTFCHSREIYANDGEFAYFKFQIKLKENEIAWGARSHYWMNAWREANKRDDVNGGADLLRWWQWYVTQNDDVQPCEIAMDTIAHDVLAARLRGFVTVNRAICKWRKRQYAQAAALFNGNSLMLTERYSQGRAELDSIRNGIVLACVLDAVDRNDRQTQARILRDYATEAPIFAEAVAGLIRLPQARTAKDFDDILTATDRALAHLPDHYPGDECEWGIASRALTKLAARNESSKGQVILPGPRVLQAVVKFCDFSDSMREVPKFFQVSCRYRSVDNMDELAKEIIVLPGTSRQKGLLLNDLVVWLAGSGKPGSLDTAISICGKGLNLKGMSDDCRAYFYRRLGMLYETKGASGAEAIDAYKNGICVSSGVRSSWAFDMRLDMITRLIGVLARQQDIQGTRKYAEVGRSIETSAGEEVRQFFHQQMHDVKLILPAAAS